MFPSKPTELDELRLVLLQRQCKLGQALLHCIMNTDGVRPILEAHYKITDVANELRFASQPWFDHAVKPQVQHIVLLRIAQHHANHSTLCRKAGVASSDVRGNITGHRARATIASQLFNSREPMSRFELQACLGHGSPASTQHYVAITPTKLAEAYPDAGYFERNPRAIEVLIDQDTLKQAVADGKPWRYYDLGQVCAPTSSSTNARIAWPARDATSTARANPPSHSFSMPRTTSCGSSSRSPALTRNVPRSTAT